MLHYLPRRAMLIVTALACCAAVMAADPPKPAARALPAIAGVYRDLAFAVSGKVARKAFKDGDRVTKGQVLLELEDQEGQAVVALYEVRANSDVEVRAAQEKLELAKIEEERLKELLASRSASPYEARRAEVNRKLAELDVAQAQRQQLETREQLRQAKARHEQYRLVATIDGVAEKIRGATVEEGETVEQLKPAVRLLVVDPICVDVPVPLADTLTLKKGDPAQVRAALPGFEQPLSGKIIDIVPGNESASDTRLVRIEAANPKALPPGTHVTVTFGAP